MEPIAVTITEAAQEIQQRGQVICEKADGTRKRCNTLEEAKEFLGNQQLLID